MNRVLNNWNAARIVRVIIGVVAMIVALVSEEYMFLVLGSMLLLQGVLDFGCCCVMNCVATDGNSSAEGVYKDEIKKYNPEK